MFCIPVFHACSARRRPSQSYLLHACFASRMPSQSYPCMFCMQACIFCTENAIAELPLASSAHVFRACSARRRPSQLPLACSACMFSTHVLHRECHRSYPCMFCKHVFLACSEPRMLSQSNPLHVLHARFPCMFCNRECHRRVATCMFCRHVFLCTFRTENAIAVSPCMFYIHVFHACSGPTTP